MTVKNNDMDQLDKLNHFLLLKKFIKVSYIEDLNTNIYYFKNKPFIIMDFSARKICFALNERAIDMTLNLKGLEDEVCAYEYLPKYEWLAIKIDKKTNLKLIDDIIDCCYLALYNVLIKGV